MSNTTSATSNAHVDNATPMTLESVFVFSLDPISLWSGRRRLTRKDVSDSADLPPQDVASLGSKKIIDPEEISDFETLKKEAHRECAKIGIRFLGGYAVPVAEATTLAMQLDDIASRFNTRKAKFVADYDAATQKWVADHPQWQEMLQEAVLNKADVEGRLHFGYSVFKVATAGDDGDALGTGLEAEVGGLSTQLYEEIAQAATLVMEKSLLGRDRVTQKILSPVRTIRKKLFGLSFLDVRVKPLVETIDFILGKLPPAGHIEGMELSALSGLIFILSSSDRMKTHGDLIVKGKSVEEAAEESIPELAAPEEPEVVAIEEVAPHQVQLPEMSAPAPVPTSTPSITITHASAPTGNAMVTGMAGMANANYGVRKISAPPRVRRV